MINKRVILDEIEENLSFIKTTYNLANTTSNYNSCIESIKNITLVPRSGTHNNFKSNDEIIIYVISGELFYSDSLGNSETFSRGNVIHIISGNGITYNIFNTGIDFLDIVKITLFTNPFNMSNNNGSTRKPLVNYCLNDNIPINQWNYRISSINGLSSIKSNHDINIYSLSLLSDEKVEFNICENRQGFLIQGYGQNIFTTNNSENKLILTGADILHITNETFEILGDIPSTLLLIETSIQ